MNAATLWYIGGGAALLAGLLIAALALFRDRSRGRRRCPRCWYDMSATPGLTCPECGRTARSERRLHATRRRPRRAAVGLILLLLGAASLTVPTFLQHGWRGVVPVWALLTAAWVWDTEDRELFRIARDRVPYDPGSLSRISRWMLVRCYADALDSDARTPHAVIEYAVELQRLGADAAPTVPALIRILQTDPDPSTRSVAALTLGEIRQQPDIAVPALVAALNRSLYVPEGYRAIGAIRSFGPAAAEAADDLLGALDAHQYVSESEIALALAAIQPDHPEGLIRMLQQGGTRRRCAVAALMTMGERAAPARDLLVEALSDPDPHMRIAAAYTVAAIGSADARAREAMTRLVRTDPVAGVRAAALVYFDNDDDPAIAPVLAGALLDTDPTVRVRAAAVARRNGGIGRLVREHLEAATRDPEPRVRYQARRALNDLAENEADGQNRAP